MGSSAGWMDVLTLGGASAARKQQRQAEAAAKEQAELAEKAAAAQKARELAPVSVAPVTKDPMQAAEEQVDKANKRKRTVSSTASGLSSYDMTGSGRRTLG